VAHGEFLHERIHQRREHRAAAENDERREDEQQDYQRDESPLLFLFQEGEEFFD